MEFGAGMGGTSGFPAVVEVGARAEETNRSSRYGLFVAVQALGAVPAMVFPFTLPT